MLEYKGIRENIERVEFGKGEWFLRYNERTISGIIVLLVSVVRNPC
jgi:hypothetical protein